MYRPGACDYYVFNAILMSFGVFTIFNNLVSQNRLVVEQNTNFGKHLSNIFNI